MDLRTQPQQRPTPQAGRRWPPGLTVLSAGLPERPSAGRRLLCRALMPGLGRLLAPTG
ncbi:MAG TPA: hypothetical protein VHR45_20355 [Thermoanaerobaculia bacterium]|nr:hypothetical protein [Thermoanaerobaculia bacterium]